MRQEKHTTHTHTHRPADEKRVCVDNEVDLMLAWSARGVYFSASFLPQVSLTTTPRVLTSRGRRTETEGSGEENGEVKKERATHRPHNGCGISYTANTERDGETSAGLARARVRLLGPRCTIRPSAFPDHTYFYLLYSSSSPV